MICKYPVHVGPLELLIIIDHLDYVTLHRVVV